jgi:hypothetical protein
MVTLVEKTEAFARLFYRLPSPLPASSNKKHYPITPQPDQVARSIRCAIIAILAQKQCFISLAPWLHSEHEQFNQTEKAVPKRRPNRWINNGNVRTNVCGFWLMMIDG